MYSELIALKHLPLSTTARGFESRVQQEEAVAGRSSEGSSRAQAHILHKQTLVPFYSMQIWERRHPTLVPHGSSGSPPTQRPETDPAKNEAFSSFLYLGPQ